MNRALRTCMKDYSPHERLSSQQETELGKLPSLQGQKIKALR